MYILCYIYICIYYVIYIIYDCYTVILWYSKNLQENPKACFVPFMFFFAYPFWWGFPPAACQVRAYGWKTEPVFIMFSRGVWWWGGLG